MSANEPSGPAPADWSSVGEQLNLVLERARFEAMLAEAARWADEITLCLTAPDSQHGRLPWWSELLARSAKCSSIQVRRPDQAEGWLLHRLHDTGALRFSAPGGKQVASNLLLFSRAEELRGLLSHLPLERALAGAAFGTLLAFRGHGLRGQGQSELVRAARAQADSWSQRSSIPTGSDIDALVRAAGRRRAPRSVATPPSAAVRVLSNAGEIQRALERLLPNAELELGSGWTARLRSDAGGHQIQLLERDHSRAPFLLTLHSSERWAAGNALLLESPERELSLVWRGGLLGASRAKQDLLWAETRLDTCSIQDAVLGSAERVQLVAQSGATFAGELEQFARECLRLGSVFDAEPPPALAHQLSDFAALAPRQQTRIVWKALLGLGPLALEDAVLAAARALRDQGYLQPAELSPQSATALALSELLGGAAADGGSFDRPAPGLIRAVQPDLQAYLLSDWLEILSRSLPEGEAIPRRTALWRAYVHAREHWGLAAPEPRRGNRTAALLEGALASAVRRGLFVRAGAGSIERLSPHAAGPEPRAVGAAAGGSAVQGFITEYRAALARLEPVQRTIVERRTGWYGSRESAADLGQRLGLAEERVRQLEAEGWRRLASEGAWCERVRVRVERALGACRSLSFRSLVTDDAWWQGIEQRPGLLSALLEQLFEGELHCVRLGDSRAPLARRAERFEEAFIARFSQADLDLVRVQLLERAAGIATPAALSAYAGLPEQSAAELDAALSEYLRDELAAHFDVDRDEPETVRGFLLPAICPDAAAPAFGAGSEARLRLEDNVRSAFRNARTPLSFQGVLERVAQRVDVTESELRAVLVVAPFVQRNADQFGLASRDVPGGHDAIAAALALIISTLEKNQRPLALSAALALVQPEGNGPWSAELLRSLLVSDSALACNATDEVLLRRWRQGASPESELACPGLPPLARGRFEQLLQEPPSQPERLLARARAELGRLERASSEDYLAMSLARHLVELYERLLEQVAQASPPSQRLAQAAIGYFLDAVAGDEEDDDGAPLDRDRLRETRAVLQAVLGQLELDWI